MSRQQPQVRAARRRVGWPLAGLLVGCVAVIVFGTLALLGTTSKVCSTAKPTVIYGSARPPNAP